MTKTDIEWRGSLKNQSWYQESDDITKVAIQVFIQAELDTHSAHLVERKAVYEELEEFVAYRRRLGIPVTVNRILEHMQSMYIRPLDQAIDIVKDKDK